MAERDSYTQAQRGPNAVRLSNCLLAAAFELARGKGRIMAIGNLIDAIERFRNSGQALLHFGNHTAATQLEWLAQLHGLLQELEESGGISQSERPATQDNIDEVIDNMIHTLWDAYSDIIRDLEQIPSPLVGILNSLIDGKPWQPTTRRAVEVIVDRFHSFRLVAYRGRHSVLTDNWLHQRLMEAWENCRWHIEDLAPEFRELDQRLLDLRSIGDVESVAATNGTDAKHGATGKPKRESAKLTTPSRFTNADEKIISALLIHHRYESPEGDAFASVGKTKAATYRQLCEISDVKSTDTITSFFGKWFPTGGNDEYKRICKSGDAKKLSLELARLVPGDVPEFKNVYIDKEARGSKEA